LLSSELFLFAKASLAVNGYHSEVNGLLVITLISYIGPNLPILQRLLQVKLGSTSTELKF